jgi:hypothetical protein
MASVPGAGGLGVEDCTDPCPGCCDGDIDQDCAEVLAEELIRDFHSLGHEVGANNESSRNVVAHAGAQKFHEVGPIEAAATELILKKAT